MAREGMEGRNKRKPKLSPEEVELQAVARIGKGEESSKEVSPDELAAVLMARASEPSPSNSEFSKRNRRAPEEEEAWPKENVYEGDLSEKLQEIHQDFEKDALTGHTKRVSASRALPQERFMHAKKDDEALLAQGADITYIGSKGPATREAFYAKRKKAFGKPGREINTVSDLVRENAVNDTSPDQTPAEEKARLAALLELQEKYGRHVEAMNTITEEALADSERTNPSSILGQDAFEDALKDSLRTPTGEPVSSAESHEVPPAPPRGDEGGPIFGLNSVLAKQMGLKGVTPVFGTDPALGTATVPVPVRDEKRIARRHRKEKRNRRFLGVLGGLIPAGILGALALWSGHSEKAPRAEHTAPSTAASAPQNPSHSSVESHVEKHGEGADKVFVRLQKKLQEAYPDAKGRSALIQELLNYKNPDDFSKHYGFETLKDKKVLSVVYREHKPDTLLVSADGNRLVYIDSKGEPRTLKQVFPGAGSMTYQSNNSDMRPYGPLPQYEVSRARVKQRVTAPAQTEATPSVPQVTAHAPVPEQSPAQPDAPQTGTLSQLS